jgi:hypothetical protein
MLKGAAVKQAMIRKEYFSLKKNELDSAFMQSASIDSNKQKADKNPNKPLTVMKPNGSIRKKMINKLITQ